MSQIVVSSRRTIAAPAEVVYGILADYRQHHPRIVPSAMSGLVVEQGGVGAGTVIRFAVKMGGNTRRFHQRVEEPEPGRVLQEIDLDGGQVTTFTVDPSDAGCDVTISTTWEAHGIRGFVERLVAPRFLRAQYEEELGNLDAYAKELAAR